MGNEIGDQTDSFMSEAFRDMASPVTGCVNERLRACKQMEWSALLRFAPYFTSPFTGHPMEAN
jgi:hypothetical protein